ncbi:ankyrin repeat domain-containing protein 54-like [Orbicella faveolata]|uniref:ankyrin repeat domain-containing protein 54-like n=1 Tax=Orbicella faveolata TaxID=48498 RepID=UPI0009E60D46|nr:ankyrin repeat domain-containing protein 54-like [Orbicella faveolata]
MASREKDEDTNAIGKELWAALKRDPLDKEQIKLLLEFGAPANFREPDSRKTGRTPLHFVVWDVNGNEELMEMLLKHGADTNLSDSFDLTPLHLAAEKGNLRAVKKLVNNPYSPADRNKRNRVRARCHCNNLAIQYS